MSHLLKKRHFASDFKMTSIKIWRRLPGSSPSHHSVALFNKTPRNPKSTKATPATYTFFTNKQYCTRKLFPCLRDCNSLSFKSNRRYLPTNQLKNNCFPRHQSLNSVNFSTASFCEPVEVGTIRSLASTGINDSELGTQVDSFTERLQNCNSLDEILCLAEKSVQTKSLPVDCFTILFDTYQKQVYKSLPFPWLLPNSHLKRKQLKENFLSDQAVEPYVTDARFQNLIAYAELQIEDIPYSDCIQLLNSLKYLFINSGNSNFADKIVDKCIENLSKLNLNQLAEFSSALHLPRVNTFLLGKIVDAAKTWLMTHSTTQDIDIKDLCAVFINTRPLASSDLFELGSQVLIRRLAKEPSSVSLETISQIVLFVKSGPPEFEESFINSFLNLPPQCFSIDTSNNSSTLSIISSIVNTSWLNPILQKLRAHCISELSTSNHVTLEEMVQYSLLFKGHQTLIPESKRELICQCVQESDNYLLFQLMRHHTGEYLRQLPDMKKVVWAYHKRFIRLFASLSHTEQEQLMWSHGNNFGIFVFHIYDKFKDVGISINPDLLRSLESHLKLQPDDWDAPNTKIIVGALYALNRLKSHKPLPPGDLSTLTKFLHRLDLNYLIDFYKKYDGLSLMANLPLSVKQQCLEVKNKLYDCFQHKLTKPDAFTSNYVSHKVLPNIKKSHHWRTLGADIFIDFMNSMPRLLMNDEKNYLQILSLLDLTSKTYPIYQAEMFEKLIDFVASSPELLVYSGMHLVNILANNGHQPENFDSFAAWSLLLVNQVMDHALISKLKLVQIAYNLSLLGIFHDKLILKIFSLDFLSAFDEELKDGGLPFPHRNVKTELALFNRSVSIECPHLTMPWFSGQLLLNEAKISNTFGLSSVVESIHRLTRLTDCAVEYAESPYGHKIDALAYFDPTSGLVKCDDVQNSQPFPEIEKIAMLALQDHDLCYNSDFLTGRCQANVRQLQILGYTVVLFTEKELSSMDVHFESGLDNYVKAKINSATRSQVFKD